MLRYAVGNGDILLVRIGAPMLCFIAVTVGQRTVRRRFVAVQLQLLVVLRLLVGLLVEIVEQEVEEDAVGQRQEDGPARIAAVGVQQLGRVQECQTELDLGKARAPRNALEQRCA